MDLKLSKEQQLLLLGLILSIIVGLGVMAFRNLAPATVNEDISIETPQETKPISLIVHISGAIRREGVYKLQVGDRLMDALKLAGGALPNADLSALNLAEIVKDGEKIIVPAKVELMHEEGLGTGGLGTNGTGDKGTKGTGVIGNGKVNLNTANVEQLDSLPGIGKSTAQKIIEYRRKIGSFQRIEQIMEIPRFGKAKFGKIKERLSL
ncbi:MAG: ComEA family DNA-binding protein [Candidatus Margulisbacteria bacterium]|nr:ComEA family DNA-binding protein [Candidatus Margulisiibacteriota bacterium]